MEKHTTGEPGRDLVPVSATVAVPQARSGVLGNVHMVDGELVVRLRPTGQYQDVTARRIGPDPAPERVCHPLVDTCLSYRGPLTGAARTKHFAVLARFAHPWWHSRRWLPWW